MPLNNSIDTLLNSISYFSNTKGSFKIIVLTKLHNCITYIHIPFPNSPCVRKEISSQVYLICIIMRYIMIQYDVLYH